MNIILFDGNAHQALLPLTFTRPVADIRIGITTIREKWAQHTGEVSIITQDYLSVKFPPDLSGDNLMLVAAHVLPDDQLMAALRNLLPENRLMKDGNLLAANVGDMGGIANLESMAATEYMYDVIAVERPSDIFRMNGQVMLLDFEKITHNRTSAHLDASCTVIGDPGLLFLEPGAKVVASVLNTTSGPIYIGNDAEIMEGCLVRGPFAMGNHARLKMGAKIYGPTTLGPHCVVGGEVNNCVFTGYSNKGHDGFLGNSVIGEWCNLGADTNTSNLKNNYSNVKVWNYGKQDYTDSGLQFCGTIMGDHGRTSINTMLNTGTVVGVAANIFGHGFPPKYVPSFSWGGSEGFEVFQLDKALEAAIRMMERRNVELTDADRQILTHLYSEVVASGT
jgi:UDP-N-acetylglucosamine diphosphorylase/glucosamine-1-phosphate N-acetyltransferase